MRKLRGFALVQVMLFTALVGAMVYALMLVQAEKMREQMASQKAASVEPAIYDIVSYAIAKQAADGSVAVKGSDYYSNNDPLSADYTSTLAADGYDVNGVYVTSS